MDYSFPKRISHNKIQQLLSNRHLAHIKQSKHLVIKSGISSLFVQKGLDEKDSHVDE